jgi:hypothetical protein
MRNFSSTSTVATCKFLRTRPFLLGWRSCLSGLITPKRLQSCLNNHRCYGMVQLCNWEVEVDEQVPLSTLSSGAAFLGSTPIAAAAQLNVPSKRMMLAPPHGQRPATLPSRRLADPRGIRETDASASQQPDVSIPAGALLLREGREGSRAVYVDSFLVKHLRPHQLEGVKFLVAVRSQPHNCRAHLGCPAVSFRDPAPRSICLTCCFVWG